MCGIAGWAVTAAMPIGQHALRSMTSSLAHRGPDGQGLFDGWSRDGRYRIGLGHRRLAIIDFAGGAQPMFSPDRHVVLVYNGELYNFPELRNRLEAAGHAFATRSDTEVVLHAYLEWGTGAFALFRGMFALAIWDARHEQLVLARDPFGEKPLFLYRRGGSVLFASEIRGLHASGIVGTEIDAGAVREYLAFRYVPGPRTMFRGIEKLMPGSYAVWRDGRLEQTRYYTAPDRSPYAPRPLPDDPIAAFSAELEEAVRIRMVSDAPYGAFLSGGIDSSSVVALMARHSGQPVRTFSVGFHEQRFNELEYAALAAREFRTQHHELVITPRDVADQLPAMVAHRGAPVSEPSDVPIYLLSFAAAKSVKMILTGEGSDELLGGYPKHLFERYATPVQPLLAPAPCRQGAALLSRALPYKARRLKLLLAALALPSFKERMPRWFGAMSPAEIERFVDGESQEEVAGSEWPFTADPQASPLRRVLFFDQTSWLPDNLLERADRMTMAASLEARVPFVDTRLAAFVSALPDRFRVRGGRGKWLLRQAMSGIVPDAIIHRQKKGFAVPIGDWFRGELRDFAFDYLGRSGATTPRYFRNGFVGARLAEHCKGIHNHQKLIWTLLTLEIFHDVCGTPRRPLGAEFEEPKSAANLGRAR